MVRDPTDGFATYIEEVQRILNQILESQKQAILEAGHVCATSIHEGGLVHLFGTGHSRVLAEEMYPRYGSYAGYHPIVELSMTYFTNVVGANGMAQTMFIERQEGLGETILENFAFGEYDSMIVFSSTGVNAVPVEIALGSRRRGLPVIALMTLEHATRASPSHSSGKRLHEVADIVIDNCGPSGDAVVEIEGLGERVGPVSTVTGAAIVNGIKSAAACELVSMGHKLACFTHPSVVGEERSRELFEESWRDHRARIGRLWSQEA